MAEDRQMDFAEDHPEHPDGLPMPRRYWAVAAVSFGIALLVIDSNIANVALPTISRALGVSEGAVTGIVTVYQLVMVMSLLPFASLGDRFGHRRFFQAGQILFCLSSALCFFAETFPVLLALRALQAIGAGMALSVGVALVREIYPARSLGGGLGFNSVIAASSAALAPTLGGFIIANFDWHFLFVAAAPFAFISLLMGRALPESTPRPGRIDWVSCVWSAATMALLIGGVQFASHDETRLAGLGLALAGLVSAWRLVLRERRVDRPIVPVDILKIPTIGFSALASVAAFCAAGMLMISLPFRLEQGMGYTPDKVGLLLLPFPLTMLFVSPLAGWLSDRVAPTKLGLPGLVVSICGLGLLVALPADAVPFDIVWRLAVTAAGFSFFVAPNTRLLIGSSPKQRSAAAGGVLSTSRLLGQASGAAVVGLLLGLGAGLGPMPFIVAIGFAALACLCMLVRFRTVMQRRIRQVPPESIF